jgi:hypothetical protein
MRELADLIKMGAPPAARPQSRAGVQFFGTVIFRTCPNPIGGGPKPTLET